RSRSERASTTPVDARRAGRRRATAPSGAGVQVKNYRVPQACKLLTAAHGAREHGTATAPLTKRHSNEVGMGGISFYEGPDATDKLVWTLADEMGQDVRPSRFAPIRSLKLKNVRAGADIRLYDGPREAPNDYACLIRVKRSASEYTVAGFA